MSVTSSLSCLTPSQLIWTLQCNKKQHKDTCQCTLPVLSDTKPADMAAIMQQKNIKRHVSTLSSLSCLTPSQLLWLLQHKKIYIKRHVSALFPVLSDAKPADMAATMQQKKT